MFIVFLTQDMQIEEEVKAKKTKLYSLEGYLGTWASDNQFYRSELAFQMQNDVGVYGRFSLISFSHLNFFTLPRIKESYIEFLFENSLDVRAGIGALFWENGLILGDYLGGNPFLEVSYGKSIWLVFLMSRLPGSFILGSRFGIDLSGYGISLYGIYDTLKKAYVGSSFYYDVNWIFFKLEGALKLDTSRVGYAGYLSQGLNLGRFFLGLNGILVTKSYERLLGQGLVFDEDRSPFLGFSTYLVYGELGIPWTYISARSGGFLRIGYSMPIDEDWVLKPSIDLGIYKSKNYFSDFHVRFDWTESIYVGVSGGGFLSNGTMFSRLAIYTVGTFNF